MDNITCQDCHHFAPDTIGDGMGLGQCLVFEAYLQKNPSEHSIRLALLDLGNAPDNSAFWGGHPDVKNRNCKKYEPKHL